jgi:hypothetical protein
MLLVSELFSFLGQKLSSNEKIWERESFYTIHPANQHLSLTTPGRSESVGCKNKDALHSINSYHLHLSTSNVACSVISLIIGVTDPTE